MTPDNAGAQTPSILLPNLRIGEVHFCCHVSQHTLETEMNSYGMIHQIGACRKARTIPLTRMVRLELFQEIHLLLLVASGAAQFLLPLIIHHLFNHRTSRAVQVAQARIFGLNLGHVDLGCCCDHMRPPFDLVDLVEMDIDFLARWVGGGFQCP